MEGGNETATELVAERLLLLLNIPLGLLGFLIARTVNNGFLLLCFAIANSCTWGFAAAFLMTFLTRMRNSVQP